MNNTKSDLSDLTRKEQNISALDYDFISYDDFNKWHEKLVDNPANHLVKSRAINDNREIDISSEEATILMVDDDDTCLYSMEIILMGSPYVLITLNSSREALQYIKSNSEMIDLIFLDLHMPEMNGLELLEAIRNDPSLSMIPVILQSAAADNKTLLSAYRLGIAGFLAKLYNKKQVLTAIRKVLDLF